MLHKIKQRTAASKLRGTYIHHILWGLVCLILFGLLLAMWFYNQSLDRQTALLEQRIQQQARPLCEARSTWQANTTKTFQIESNEIARSYMVHLPKDFNPKAYYPMVLFFPGKGGSAIDAERGFGMNGLPAIVIYPQPTLGKDNFYSWQGAPYSSGADDVQFVSDIIDKVSGQLCIDRTRIYAVGMSNGGGMAAVLSCRMPDRIAAFGIVAGAFYYPTSDCAPKSPTPIINIHGDSDIVVPYDGSAIRKLPRIDDWVAFRAAKNGCNTKPYSLANPGAITTTWQFCRDGASVQNIRLHDTGHVWMKDATQTIWKFLSSYKL